MVGGVGQALNLAFPRVSVWLADSVAIFSADLSSEIRARPEHPWAVLTAACAIALLLSGGYRRIERVSAFLVGGVTLITVCCVACLPALGYPVGWHDIGDGFSLAVLTLPGAAIAAAFGAFGITGVGASELFAYPYWCIEKGYCRYTGIRSDDATWVRRARGWMRVMYLDAWISMAVFTLATVAFYVLGATVLLFKTLYVSSASNSRLSADFLGLTRLVQISDRGVRTKWISRFCAFYPALALVLYFWQRDPKAMVIIGGFFQAATLPVISGAAVYLRYRRTDRRLAPSRISDVCLWTAFFTISVVALYAIPYWAINDFWPTVREWIGESASS
jgi:Mn2+/Fe2+ NRAMP family transporter